jgi:hypothetical protein
MKNNTEIQCPNCGGKIFINAQLLLRGGGFSCTTASCDASVSLSNSSHQVANNAMKEFENIKRSQL